MNTFKSLLIAVTVSFSFAGCSHSSHDSHHEHETEAHDGHHHSEGAEAIELNGGERWTVNDEMKPYVIKGQEIVAAFVQNNGTDYAKLAKEVAEQNDHLIQSCTMQGKSHDELHKWLHPHLELVKELSTTTDADKAKELVIRLEKSYQQYDKYFN